MIGGTKTTHKSTKHGAKVSRKSPRIPRPTKKYEEYLKNLKSKYPKCNVDEMVVVMNGEIDLAEEMNINTLINNFTSMDINEGKMNGGGIGNPFPSYLIAIVKKIEEGGQALNAVYANIHTILEKGLELLQFLSNKNNCLRDYLKYLVGKNITKLLEYYVIGAIFISSNPLQLLNVLRSILNMIGLTIIPFIGGTVSIITGKYVSAISKYYLEKGQSKAADKATELQTKLNEFVNMSDEETVESIKNAANDLHTLIETEMKPIPIMTEEEKDDFMNEVKEGLTQEQRDLLNNVGEFVDAQSVEKMHEEMERQEAIRQEKMKRKKARQEEEARQKEAEKQVVGEKRKAGGKRHRKTKKHHKKSQKKHRKKSHKRHHKKK